MQSYSCSTLDQIALKMTFIFQSNQFKIADWTVIIDEKKNCVVVSVPQSQLNKVIIINLPLKSSLILQNCVKLLAKY